MFSLIRERKLGDRRRLDTVVVTTVNVADSGSVTVVRDVIGTVGEIKVFGFWGEYGRKAET